MLEKLYFAKFPDGALYCANAQGPMAYETQEMAQEIAGAIAGKVVERSADYAVNWCREKGYILLITLSNGRVVASDDTPGGNVATTRVEGEERNQLIEIGRRQRGTQ